MMILFALLGLFQATILHGLIIGHYVKLPERTLPKIATIILISILVNFNLVFILLYFKLYIPNVVSLIFFVEMLFASFIYRKKLSLLFKNKNTLADTHEVIIAKIKLFYQNNLKSNYTANNVLLFLSFSIILIFFVQMLKDIGSIFYLWDDVVSWNRWAVEMSQNHYPMTWHYPQLIPAIWANIYIFAGYPLQFLAKSIVPFFPLCVLLILFDLAIHFKKTLFYWAIIVFYFVMQKFWGSYIFSGYVDLPLACLSFISILFISYSINNKLFFEKSFFTSACLSICAAALTKQAGLFLLFFFPLFIFLISRDLKKHEKVPLKCYMLQYICLSLIFVAPFYLYTEFNIYMKIASSETTYILQTIHGGKSYIERFTAANLLLKNTFKYFFLLALLFSSFYAMYKWKFYRITMLVFALPYYLVWCLFFSYDIRNLSFCIPFFSLGVSFTINEVFYSYIINSKTYKLLAKSKILFIVVSLIILTLLTLIYHPKFSTSYLIKRQTELSMKIGNNTLNQLLYKYFENAENLDDKKILTNYQYLGFLPNLKTKYVLSHFSNLPNEDIFFQDYLQQIQNKEIGYILLRGADNKLIHEDITTKISSEEYKVIFDKENYKFIKIIR